MPSYVRPGIRKCAKNRALSTNHMAGIPLDDNINIVEFSKDKHNGRYGYLDGIYDVSDES